MAESAMEVDMARPVGIDHQVDEDLIDFDTDMHDEHEPTSQHNDHSMRHSIGVTAHVDEIDVDVETGETHIEQEADAEMSEEVDLVEETMDDVGQTADVNDTDEHGHYAMENHDEESVEIPQEASDGPVDISQNLNTDAPDPQDADNAAENPHGLENEIDYELGEHTDQPEQQPEEPELRDETGLEDENGTAPADTQTPAESKIETKDSLLGEEVTTEFEEGQKEQNDPQDIKREEEITYEEEDEHVSEETSVHTFETVPIGSAEAVTNNELDEPHPQGEDDDGKDDYLHEESEGQSTTKNEDADHTGFDEYDVTADVEEHTDGQVAHESEQGHSPYVHNLIAASDSEFPAISVCYKGDEFPFFSNTSNGFFTETSILDETMDKLLAGFRAELASEICPEDELVFQVDELGLEFTESSSPDCLSSTTLRQVLEIFDILVKNQNPEHSRTLYTYLFTRLCTTKRLEFLIESAAAGKSLKEIAQLFESPPVPTGNRLDTNTADDVSNERSDVYDSPVDQTEEGNREELELENEHEDDGADLDSSAAEHDYVYDSPADKTEETSREELEPGSQYDEDIGVDLDSSALEHGHEEDDKEDEENRELADAGRPDDDDDDDDDDVEHDAEDLEPTHDEASDPAALEEQGQENANEDNESHLLSNFDLFHEEDEDDLDLEAVGVANEHSQPDPNDENVDAANTSTTTTLRGDDETGSVNVESSAYATNIESTGNVEAEHEDELEEIDWNEEEPGTHDIPSPQSVTGKRHRGDDDEFDVEDEQDVKRRRP